MRSLCPIISVCLLLSCVQLAAQSQDDLEPLTLEITGRVSEGDRRMEGCSIRIFKGNELVGDHLTEKSGRFGFGLGMGEEFALEFSKEGFLPKRVIVDTRAQLPKDLEEIVPIYMDMSMLVATKYDGANTDMLDFPFAMIGWDKSARAFVQDQQYTVDMMRTNGALLLQSGRAVKK